MKLFKTTTPENATHLARELDRARPKHDEEWIAPYELPTEEEIDYNDLMNYIKKRWEQLEATIKRNKGDEFQIYRTGVEDGIELSYKAESPIKEQDIIEMSKEYFGPGINSTNVLMWRSGFCTGAKAITNLLKGEK